MAGEDILTVSPTQVPLAADMPADAAVFFAGPDGRLQRTPADRLLAKLIATDLVKTDTAALNADLAHAADAVALVHNDPAALNNGWWRKLGASGTGSWEQFDTLARAPMDAAAESAAEAIAAAAQVTTLGFSPSRPRSGWNGATINAATGRIYEGVRGTGAVWKSGVTRAALDVAFAALIPALVRPRSGWLNATVNNLGRVSQGKRSNGTDFGLGGLTAVLEANLAVPLRRRMFKERSTVRPVKPDGLQSEEARFGATTHIGGYQWQRLPHVEGAQYIRQGQPFTSSVAFQFRRRLKVNEAGKRKIGAWSPGTIASSNKLGIFSNNSAHGITALPAASGKAEGDYYIVFLQGGGSLTVGSVGTVYNGDIIVNHDAGSGLAWTLQASPANGLANSALAERDWWELSGSGTFDGVTYAAGDRIVHFGGSYYHFFRRGRPDLGEMFTNGELSGSAGVAPSNPKQGDAWQITTAGTISGVTLAVDDWLLHDGAAFYSVATTPITTTASGKPFLIEISGDTSDYEVRRSDKSTSRYPVRLFVPSQAAARAETDSVVWLGDSMTDYARTAISAAFSDRTVDILGNNSAGAGEVASRFEYLILSGQFGGRATIGWMGQNGENDWQQALEGFLRMYRVCSNFDRYFIPVTPAGRRAMIFNGARLVGQWHEPMKAGTDLSNGLVALVDAMNKPTWPFAGRYVDARKAVIDAVAANAATFAANDLQFPGMTEAQTAATYGLIPLSIYFDIPGAGLNPATASYQGFWSDTTNLPTGGANGDYFLRSVGLGTSDSSVGNIIAKISETWTELTTGSVNSVVHFGGPNAAIANTAVAAKVRALFDLYAW